MSSEGNTRTAYTTQHVPFAAAGLISTCGPLLHVIPSLCVFPVSLHCPIKGICVSIGFAFRLDMTPCESLNTLCVDMVVVTKQQCDG